MDEINIEKLEDLVMDNSFQDYVAGRNNISVKKWEEWIEQHPSQQKEFDTAVQVMKVLLNARKRNIEVDSELSLRQILTKIEIDKMEQKASKRSLFSPWMKIAAMLVLLVGISILLYFASQFNMGLRNETAFNELIVPIGEKAQIVLSDGSHVWINSGSKLKYPTTFSQKNRTVYLQGEAYFDVKKKNGAPFYVTTDAVNIKVLGTAFNVKSYPGDKNVETTVIRGLVRVENKFTNKTVLLNPKEKCIVPSTANENAEKNIQLQNTVVTNQSNEGVTVVQKVNTDLVISWKDQLLVFQDERFEELVVKMERWYNVKIVIQDESLKDLRFRGKFVNNETVYQVLDAIKLTSRIKYKVENNIFYIKKSQ